MVAVIAAKVAQEIVAAQQKPVSDTEDSDVVPEQGEPAKGNPEEPKGAESDQPVPRRKRQE